jgi:hypothetical protein
MLQCLLRRHSLCRIHHNKFVDKVLGFWGHVSPIHISIGEFHIQILGDDCFHIISLGKGSNLKQTTTHSNNKQQQQQQHTQNGGYPANNTYTIAPNENISTAMSYSSPRITSGATSVTDFE